MKRYIAVRLYDDGYMASIGKQNLVRKEFAGELSVVIVFDFPNTITNIKPEQMESWHKSIDELYAIGIENVRNNYTTKIEAVEFGPDQKVIYSCESEHLFATNILFDMEKQDGLIGKAGSLVAVPNRSLALIYPINDLQVVGVIKSLCLTVPKLCHNNPGSLTSEIYWYRNGKFILLPYESTKTGVSFSPPDEFIAVLNSLS